MFPTLVSLYRKIVIDRPKTTLSIVFAMTVGLALGLPNFKLDASSDSLTLENDNDLNYFREIAQRYSSGDFLIVTYKPTADLFSDESIALLQQLRGDLSQLPRVSSITSMLDVPLLYSPPITLRQMGTPRTLLTEGVDRQMAKQEFLTSPIYRELILGPDGQTTALLINLEVDLRYLDLVKQRDELRAKRSERSLTEAEEKALAEVSQVFLDYRTSAAVKDRQRVEQVRGIVDKYKDRAQLFVGGATMITADMIDFIRSDLMVFGSGILVLMVIIMAIIFRQKRFVILPILSSATAVLMMLGVLSWLDWRLTVISSNFVALLLIIGLAITIHLLVRYREYHAQGPSEAQSELVMKTVIFMARPCLYTTLTTMVAFASLVVSGIRPVIDFGWMMTMGLAVALVLSFIIIPAGLMLLKQGAPHDTGDNSAAITSIFSRFTEKHLYTVVALSVVLAVSSFYGIKRLEVENRFIDYFHDSTEIYKGMTVIDENLGGTITLDVILDVDPQVYVEDVLQLSSGVAHDEDPFAESDDFDSDDPFAAEDPFAEDDAFDEDVFAEDDPFSEQNPDTHQKESYWFTVAGLQDVTRVHEYLDSLPQVGKVQSLGTLYEVGSDIAGAPLNDFELALLKQSLSAEIEASMISPYLSEAEDQTRISLRVKEGTPNLRRADLLADIHSHLINELGFKEEQVSLSGLMVLYNNMLQSLFTSQIVTIGAVFVAIMAMFLVLFRSLSVSVIAMVPNLLAASVVLSGMGWFGVPLDMMTITIAAIAVGIGVDDTIHYIHRYKKEFEVDGNYIASMHRAHATIGRAMFYTSTIIVVGFSILALSKFIPSVYFGLLTGLAMITAILGALTLLPCLILIFKPFGAQRSGVSLS